MSKQSLDCSKLTSLDSRSVCSGVGRVIYYEMLEQIQMVNKKLRCSTDLINSLTTVRPTGG